LNDSLIIGPLLYGGLQLTGLLGIAGVKSLWEGVMSTGIDRNGSDASSSDSRSAWWRAMDIATSFGTF
jgi:hypothetical protein